MVYNVTIGVYCESGVYCVYVKKVVYCVYCGCGVYCVYFVSGVECLFANSVCCLYGYDVVCCARSLNSRNACVVYVVCIAFNALFISCIC